MIVYELILNIVCVFYENLDFVLYGYILLRYYIVIEGISYLYSII